MNKVSKLMMLSLSMLTFGSASLVIQAPIEVEASSKYQTKANLNLRTGASTKNKILLTIPKGKSVTYKSKHGSWYKVSYGKKTGFVSSNYLKKQTNQSKSTSKPKQSTKKSNSKSGFTKKVMDVEVTAYTFNSGKNITASGKKLSVGDVSAPKEIPFGSTIDIPSIQKQLGKSSLTVHDRGSAIKRLSNNKIRIDVAFPTRKEALKFGRKTYKNVPVYIKN